MGNYVKQLSIFLENKAGSLNEIFELLSKANICIIASTLSDTTEYGILRLITDDNDAAYALLKENKKDAVLRDILVVECGAGAGSLYNILQLLGEESISVEYMYSFTAQNRCSYAVLHLSDNSKAAECFECKSIKTLSNKDLLEI